MMTLREVAPPEGIPSSPSSSSSSTLDPQKAKIARRRRIEINKLKNACKEQHSFCQNDVVYTITAKGGSIEINSSNNNNNKTLTDTTAAATCCGVVSVMGRRREMEDTVRVERCFTTVGPTRFDFYGVYDGHGGSHVAEACRDRVHVILAEEMAEHGGGGVEWGGVMERCFGRVDGEVCGGRKAEEVEEMTVGSTAVAAVVGDDVVVVANCGDSRAVLCRDGVAVPLSSDHKPDRPDELARIESAGGRVINWNGHRVLGVLATSRSIGDHYLKPYVSSTPEITITQRTDGDEFLILASDGLWDVITNEVACNVVRRCLTGKIQRRTQEFTNGRCKRNSSKAEIAAALLVELAIAKGSKDNISVVVVELKKSLRINC